MLINILCVKLKEIKHFKNERLAKFNRVEYADCEYPLDEELGRSLCKWVYI